jgi:hypothetical protein
MRRLFMVWAMGGLALLTPVMAVGSDQELAQQIAGNLKNSGRMKGYNISVKVQGSVVQLDGSVRNDTQLEQALSIAEVTPGIERVINNLSVKEARDASAPLALRQPASVARADKQVVRRATRPTVTTAVRQASAEVPADEGQQAFHYDAPPQMPPTMNQSRTAARGAPRPIQRVGGANHGQGAPNYGQMARASYPPEMIPPGSAEAMHMQGPMPAYAGAVPMGVAPARYDQPHMPGYAWPSYAAYPNYAALTYPKQYSPTAWPFIGPFYPYPQVPLGWRKVSLEWDNGWWMLDFKDSH